jgi:triphosphoribosyl-dephospho-CoA synthase
MKPDANHYSRDAILVGIDFFAEVACIWEVSARKVGNVYPGADFRDCGTVDFLLSAAAIRTIFQWPGHSGTGFLIRRATEETRSTVGTNTNLGIILLLAPLVNAVQPVRPFRGAVQAELDRLNIQDAQQVYHAIRLANPGGLGETPEQDVRNEPTVTLLEAMRLAADRDMIARQYANGFADVFDFGMPAFVDAFARFGCVEAAIIDLQFRWLAEYPDSLIARKNGIAVAEDVQRRAAKVRDLGGIATPEGRAAGVALDKHLRSDSNKLNPGTTADLITACLFVALRENKVAPSAPFRWDVADWL